VDTLEKRVKSRFSHRIIHLRLPNSLDDYIDIVNDALTVKAGRLTSVKAAYINLYNESVKVSNNAYAYRLIIAGL
jgi:hypothetical protein